MKVIKTRIYSKDEIDSIYCGWRMIEYKESARYGYVREWPHGEFKRIPMRRWKNTKEAWGLDSNNDD